MFFFSNRRDTNAIWYKKNAIWALIRLVTLTFDLWIPKQYHSIIPYGLHQVWTLWDHSFSSYAADKKTDRLTDWLEKSDRVGVGNNIFLRMKLNIMVKFVLCIQATNFNIILTIVIYMVIFQLFLIHQLDLKPRYGTLEIWLLMLLLSIK